MHAPITKQRKICKPRYSQRERELEKSIKAKTKRKKQYLIDEANLEAILYIIEDHRNSENAERRVFLSVVGNSEAGAFDRVLAFNENLSKGLNQTHLPMFSNEGGCRCLARNLSGPIAQYPRPVVLTS